MAYPGVDLAELPFLLDYPNGTVIYVARKVEILDVLDLFIVHNHDVYLSLCERINPILFSACRDYLYTASVVFGKSAHKLIVESCFKTARSIHIVAKVDCAYNLFTGEKVF